MALGLSPGRERGGKGGNHKEIISGSDGRFGEGGLERGISFVWDGREGGG